MKNTKKCNGCDKEFPATPEYWNRTKSTKDGLHTKCKECKAKYNKKYRLENKEKVARREKKYRENNKEKIEQRKHKEYEKNKDRCLAQSRARREKNKDRDAELKHNRYLDKIDEIKDYNRRYYIYNSDKIKDNAKKWVQDNPEKFKVIQARRRDRKNKLDCKLTAEQVALIKEVFKYKCFKCGSDSDLCFDHHIPLSKGAGLSIKNTVLLCKSCNSSKHSKMPEEFYDDCEIEEIKTIFKILMEKCK